ncbi:extracellular solute-binding protein [Natronospora cellulosivora (SeqCode)]
MKTNMNAKVFIFLLILTLIFSLNTLALAGLNNEQVNDSADVLDIDEEIIEIADVITGFEQELNYAEYIIKYQEQNRPDLTIEVPVREYSKTNMDLEIVEDFAEYQGEILKTGELSPDGDMGYVEWEFQVPESGLYNIVVEYYPLPARSGDIQRDLWINGQRPFAGAQFIEFTRIWGDATEVLVDSQGNHIRPRQEEKPMWREIALRDSLGYYPEPYLFYFEEGMNTLRLSSRTEPMAIASINLTQKKEAPFYKEVKESYQEKGYQETEDIFIKIQGQDAVYRSDNSLFATHDSGDPTVEPYHPSLIRLNSIGGHRWDSPGQWISWEFEVPEDGLYQIAIKAKQDQKRGIFSYRKLLINGEAPFKEVENIPFNFSQSYQMNLLADDNDEVYLFYLPAGKNTLTLEVVLGEIADIIRQVEEKLYELNTIYRQIIMVTSTNPDPLRDYQLDRRMPGLVDSLSKYAKEFELLADELEGSTDQIGEQSQFLRNMVRLLNRMVERPHRIPAFLEEFKDNTGAMGTWIVDVQKQALQIDYMLVTSPEVELPRANPSSLQTLTHEIRSLLATFTTDYRNIGDISQDDREFDEDREELTVWIGLGRDQAQVLKQMIEDTFTPATGIPVSLELISGMGGLLIPATLANTGPDVALGTANMELAFRDALTDLKQFPDFDEVATRFKRSAFVPFTLRDSVFALPEMQSFPMLFYRKDILAELGIDVPQTWDDVIDILPVLRRHNMEFGLPPSIGAYLMFLYQQEVSLYHPDMVKTNLESEVSIRTFQQLSNLFTLYNLPYQFNIQNRFKLGEMPLVITGYGLYNNLQVFAPELRGEWGFTLVPGTVLEDGTINRTVPVTGSENPAAVQPQGGGQSSSVQGMAGTATTGAVILNNSDMKDEAWEFLKWWTEAETQARYGMELESLMGDAARYATANVEAMQMLPWQPEERQVLLEQWEWVEGIPPVPGGYYVNRQFDWLFRAVVLRNEPLRDSIQDYNRRANEEISRKRREFGFETSLDDLTPEIIASYWSQFTHINRLELDRYLDEEIMLEGGE